MSTIAHCRFDQRTPQNKVIETVLEVYCYFGEPVLFGKLAYLAHLLKKFHHTTHIFTAYLQLHLKHDYLSTINAYVLCFGIFFCYNKVFGV